MAEVGFPGQHTTTTTVTSNTTVQTNIRFDSAYIRTVPGILKCICIFTSLLGFICIQVSAFRYHSRGEYFSWISMIAFWFSGILLVLYLFHIVEKFFRIPWMKIEMGFCAIWAFLYLIAASLAVDFPTNAFIAAGVFGFMATLAYAIDAFLKWQGVRSGGLAQGSRVVSKQITSHVSTVTTPEREAY